MGRYIMTAPNSYTFVLWTLSKGLELKKFITDSARGIGKDKVSEIGKFIYFSKISKLLDELVISQELKIDVLRNVMDATLVNDFTRAIRIFELLKKYGLKKDTANEFLKGAHFKINDGGELYNELSKIGGAETRCSSHFKKHRAGDEKGINAGRILPEILMIKTNINGVISSHFQAESSPWRINPADSLLNMMKISGQTLQNLEHITESLKYVFAKIFAVSQGVDVHNLGPYGWSKFDDANPITNLKALPASPAECLTSPTALNNPEEKSQLKRSEESPKPVPCQR